MSKSFTFILHFKWTELYKVGIKCNCVTLAHFNESKLNKNFLCIFQSSMISHCGEGGVVQRSLQREKDSGDSGK